MKKFLTLAVVLVLGTVFLTGCSLFPSCGGETRTSETMSVKPWSNLYNYEKTSYEVVRYAAINNEDGSFSADMDKVLAEGSYVSEISTADIAIAEWSGITGLTEDVPLFESRILSRISELSAVPSAYSVLRTTFTVTYNDASENGDYAGKTDTISSVVLFRNINMLPVFSYKTADLQASNASYSAFADYLAGENIYSQSDVDGTVTDRVTSISQNYDNEMMFLLERTQTGLKDGISTSISVHNSVETGVYDKEAVVQLGVNVTADNSEVVTDNYALDSDAAFIGSYVGDDLMYYDEEAAKEAGVDVGWSFPINTAVFYRNTTNMGTATTAYYSDVDFDHYGMNTSNVLLYFATYETDPFEGDATSLTIATISDYTIVP